jgi:hypothetical protein
MITTHSTPLAFLAMLACCGSHNTASAAAKSVDLANGFVTVHVLPQLGGRVIQYQLGDHPFFWVNPALVDKTPPASGLDAEGGWLNYGGDKLWPAPQGWDNDDEWPGPPDGVLDGQPYAMEKLPVDQDGRIGVRLTSRDDPRSGIRFSRTIRLDPEGSRVSFEATMTNVDTKPRRWGIWSHIQLDGFNAKRTGHNPLMNAYCPINPNSHFPKGFSIIFGKKDNPSFQPDYAAGMMKVNYQYQVGKIGLDSHAGWLATVNGETGHAFIQRFVFESDQPYPDGASVEFWHNGIGSIQAYQKTMTMDSTIDKNPCVFESEVLSPYAKLAPGETSTFKYQWQATTIGGDFPITECNDAGVTCLPLAASWSKGKLQLTGRFGVFAPGQIRVILYGPAGETISSEIMKEPASPLKPLVVDLTRDAATQPADVVIEWSSKTRDRQGVLAHTKLRAPAPAAP